MPGSELCASDDLEWLVMGAPGLHCRCGAGEGKQWERNEAWRVEKLGTNWVTGRALCGPHWVTGMEGASSPARAAMPNTPARSWGVWETCGAPVGCILGGILAASFALAQGAGSAVLAQQPQEVSAISAKGLENKRGRKDETALSPGSWLSTQCVFTSVPLKWQVWTGVWGPGA